MSVDGSESNPAMEYHLSIDAVKWVIRGSGPLRLAVLHPSRAAGL